MLVIFVWLKVILVLKGILQSELKLLDKSRQDNPQRSWDSALSICTFFFLVLTFCTFMHPFSFTWTPPTLKEPFSAINHGRNLDLLHIANKWLNYDDASAISSVATCTWCMNTHQRTNVKHDERDSKKGQEEHHIEVKKAIDKVEMPRLHSCQGERHHLKLQVRWILTAACGLP